VPKVTVGVCVKNSEKTLPDAIKSIIDQFYPPELMEVVFVDDGSVDQTLPIINSCLSQIPMASRVFHHDWRGLGYSRNVVVNNAVGEYVIWVDGDMRLTPDFVGRQVAYMDENRQVGVAKGRYCLQESASLVAYLQDVNASVELLNSEKEPLSQPLGTGGSIYRVEAIREVGGFDDAITGVGEDMDAEFRIRSAGWMLKVSFAEFYEMRRSNWGDLWREYFWHGAGGRSIVKRVNPHSMLYRMFPPSILLEIVNRSCRGYSLTHRKVVFLLPLQWIFKRTAWLLGFATGS
jgi:glycosyltransferase involved in cell wall biosynthesis